MATFFKATEAKHGELLRRLAATSAQAVADDDLPGIKAFVEGEEPWPAWPPLPNLVLPPLPPCLCGYRDSYAGWPQSLIDFSSE